MSIFEPEQIDAMGVFKNNLELLLIDTLDWKYEEEHFEMLQEKINNYLIFLDSKQYTKKYSNAVFEKIIISIHFQYDLIEKAVDFLNVVSQQLAEAGYTLHIHLPE